MSSTPTTAASLQFVTLSELAEALGCSYWKARKRVLNGEFPNHVRYSTRFLFAPEVLQQIDADQDTARTK